MTNSVKQQNQKMNKAKGKEQSTWDPIWEKKKQYECRNQ
jgi:hypothetical protein